MTTGWASAAMLCDSALTSVFFTDHCSPYPRSHGLPLTPWAASLRGLGWRRFEWRVSFARSTRRSHRAAELQDVSASKEPLLAGGEPASGIES